MLDIPKMDNKHYREIKKAQKPEQRQINDRRGQAELAGSIIFASDQKLDTIPP